MAEIVSLLLVEEEGLHLAEEEAINGLDWQGKRKALRDEYRELEAQA